MHLTTLENVLWAAGFLGHVALFVVLVGRKRWRQFPLFTLFAAAETLGTLVLFVVSRHASYRAYVTTYWTLDAIDFALQLGLLFEIARNVLQSTGTWVRDARWAFLGWLLFGFALAACTAAMVSPQMTKGLSLWGMRANVFTTVLTLELFLAISMWANRLGLQWRNHVMALGQGLGIWAVTAAVGDVGHVIYGWTSDFHAFDLARQCVYLGALAYWTASFALPEREKAPMTAEMEEYLLRLHRRVQYDLNGIH